MAATPQNTDFSRDVLGRYICNDLDEANASTLGDASPFHYIVIGGGLFGGSLASFLFGLDPASEAFNDPFPRYHSRILVLEAGSLVLPEHSQNLAIGLFNPSTPTSLANERQNLPPGQQPNARNEVWGIAWHSDQPFIGQAYCVGGKSLFWGGWAPRFLLSEMPTAGPGPNWPQRVVDELDADDPNTGYSPWDDAAHQLGVDDPNDFVNGELHECLRPMYFDAIANGDISNMIPVAELPEYLQVEKIPGPPPSAADVEKMKLDAPYAVQSSTRSGFFPFNKFSSVPLMTGAARQAAGQSQKSGDQVLNNSRKQIMIVPNTRVIRLHTLPVGSNGNGLRRVVQIETNRGVVNVGHNAAVFFALGAIEGARLALDSFPGIPGRQHVGKNLMAHVRTDAFFSVPRNHKVNGTEIFSKLKMEQIEMSGVQLRGRIKHTSDMTNGHFHLQVVASGRPADGDADAEIFRKVPDIDQFAFFRDATRDERIGIAIRGIGEMAGDNPVSEVRLDPETDEFGIRRAFVHIDSSFEGVPENAKSQKAKEILNAMRQATDDVFDLFQANKDNFNINGIGTTYHESGTLRMGNSPADSVVNADLRFHGVTNGYVADTSVLPTCGSANPVQPGVALARRLALHLAKPSSRMIPSGGMFLFEDTPTPFWRMSGAPGDKAEFGFGTLDMLSAEGPFGLYWCTIPTPPNFELSLDWLSTDANDNSGILVRFPDPDRPPPGQEKVFTEPGAIAAEYGFEIQIDAQRLGSNPVRADGSVAEVVDPKFRGTGAIYNESLQTLNESLTFPTNQWHTFIIRAVGNKVTVAARVNGGSVQQMSDFTFNPANYAAGDLRGLADRGTPGKDTDERGAKRYVGLQSHFQTRRVLYRNIFLKPV